MDRSLNPRLARLDLFVGHWEMTATSGDRTMSTAPTTFRWLGDQGFLVQRVDQQTYLTPEWVGAAPRWSEAVIGLDDHTDTFTMLYTDARGVCRTYRMTLDSTRWTLAGQAGPDFHQRFDGTFTEDHSVINARWEASRDGHEWTTDFDVTYRRLPG